VHAQLNSFDLQMLTRAMTIARKGRGLVEPNPLVGCVLTRDGQIIGEGHHTHFGGPHAEPTALASLQTSAAGATAYVTLEPCCHLNKKTPPCAQRLIREKIARVVIGCLDPNPAVNGNGVALLREAGITVDLAPPDVAAGFRQLIAPFIALTQQPRKCTVTLKWAQTASGFVGGSDRSPLRISCEEANRFVHEQRAEHAAVIVGVDTVLADDPQLTVRLVEVEKQPVRVVLDGQLRLPLSCRLMQTPGVRVVTSRAMVDSPRASELRAAGAKVIAADRDETGIALSQSIDDWELDRGRRDVFVETGPRLAESLLKWADRLLVIRSPDAPELPASAPQAATIPSHWQIVQQRLLGRDTLSEYLNTRSPQFFAALPSV
jgi:diaminohydroxyphosphoribosylaminopyrimidine deaminase / 5-amino-6-(5-phosphoribosylamino)uracil reductase